MTFEAARRDPEALIAGDKPLTIDKVQRSPDLLLVVKRAVDQRRTPASFSGAAWPGLAGGFFLRSDGFLARFPVPERSEPGF